MTRCVHCGKLASREYSLVFQGESGPREMELHLCESCLSDFEAQSDVFRSG